MVVSKVPPQTRLSDGVISLCLTVTVAGITSLLLVSQLTVVLRGAETSGTAKGYSSHRAAADAGGASGRPGRVQAEALRELEYRMFELINQQRADRSHLDETRGRARPLKWDEQLAEIARAHSRDMEARSYVGHFSPDGSFPALRISQAGIPYSGVAENVAKFRDVFRAQATFISEPPFGHNHRSTILDPDLTDVGIGIVLGADGMYYITQDFVQKP